MKAQVSFQRKNTGLSLLGDASPYAQANDARDFALKLCELLDDPERQWLKAMQRNRKWTDQEAR